MRTVTLETAVAELLRDIHDADHKHCVDVETIARAYSAICAGPDETIRVVAGDKTASDDYLDGRPVVSSAAPVKHRVSVTVEVEVETDPGEASEPGNVIMSAVEAVRDGEGTVVAHEII